MSTYNNKYDILASTIAPNPASVKYWADLASNPNGGDLKYFDGKEWKYVNNQATSDIKVLRNDLTSEVNRATSRENEIEAKVDALIGDAPVEINSTNIEINDIPKDIMHMKSCYSERPEMIQKLDDNSYAFNYNIEEVKKDDNTYYECEQVIINESNINDDSIIRDVLLNNWDVNQQLKMVNDYFAYKLGLNKDEMCKTRYENFLDFRSKLKTSVTKSII